MGIMDTKVPIKLETLLKVITLLGAARAMPQAADKNSYIDKVIRELEVLQ